MCASLCDSVCQISHRSQHKEACKQQAAKLYDEALFKQPPKENDCPVCFLLLPSLSRGKVFMPCCSKTICKGCSFEHKLHSSGSPTCPFCRAAFPSAKECIEMLEKRVGANDARAMDSLAGFYIDGDEDCGVQKDTNKAVELYHRAAELGSAAACHNLGVLYSNGDGVNKDETKAKQYYEKSAMAGSAVARINLGTIDAWAGRLDRAMKHWLIAASQGEVDAVENIKRAVTVGDATRDHYAQALRGYSEYLDEVRSCQRDRAAAYNDKYKYLSET